MKDSIKIEGYLTQAKLGEALRKLPIKFLGSEVRVPGTRYRWDFLVEINGKTTVIEFDGDAHYRDALLIRNDVNKNNVALGLGYNVVRIPYWLQLTSETLKHFTGLEASIVQDFPHGFIDKKAVLPASYCDLGTDRFLTELGFLPEHVTKRVVDTLVMQEASLAPQYVTSFRQRQWLSDYMMRTPE